MILNIKFFINTTQLATTSNNHSLKEANYVKVYETLRFITSLKKNRKLKTY